MACAIQRKAEDVRRLRIFSDLQKSATGMASEGGHYLTKQAITQRSPRKKLSVARQCMSAEEGICCH